MNLSERLEKFIQVLDSSDPYHLADESYQDTFANEGYRKAEYIIQDLKQHSDRNHIDLSKLGFLSIGGADGSEAESILRETTISTAVLLEYSDSATEKARNRARDITANLTKRLEVLQGDAISRLNDGLDKLRELGCSGIVCSAQAILHELPKRSASFSNFPTFLGQIFKGFEVCAFYSREPCLPKHWPKEVRISIPGIEGERLAVLARRISERLQLGDTPVSLAKNEVLMSNVLALETFHKLLRCDTPSKFLYEIDEQLTSFDPEAVVQHIRHFLGDNSTKVKYLTSSGFEEVYNNAEVVAIDHQTSSQLEMPFTHVQIIGFNSSMGVLPEKRPNSEEVLQIPGEPRSPKPLNDDRKALIVEDENTNTSPRNPLNQINSCEIVHFNPAEIVDAEAIVRCIETIKQQLDRVFKEKFNTQNLPDAYIISTTLECIQNIQTSIYSIEDSLENINLGSRRSIVYTILNDQPPGIKGILHNMAVKLTSLDGGANKENATTVEEIKKSFRELPRMLNKLLSEMRS